MNVRYWLGRGRIEVAEHPASAVVDLVYELWYRRHVAGFMYFCAGATWGVYVVNTAGWEAT